MNDSNRLWDSRVMKPLELDTRLPTPTRLLLCTNAAQYSKLLSSEGMDFEKPPFLREGADATLHSLNDERGRPVYVVCVDDSRVNSGVAVACLIFHEATHVWQNWCDRVGETTPGREQEAYAIGWIARDLMFEYMRQKGIKDE